MFDYYVDDNMFYTPSAAEFFEDESKNVKINICQKAKSNGPQVPYGLTKFS